VLGFAELVVVLGFALVARVVAGGVEEAGFEEVGAEEAGTEEGDVPPAEHPTRVELIETSSYQKVLVSPPYDSQPKYTPVILGIIVLFVHPESFGLPFVVRPAIAALFNQVSILPSVPKWYSKHSQAPTGRASEDATPCGERSGRVASSVSRLYIKIWS